MVSELETPRSTPLIESLRINNASITHRVRDSFQLLKSICESSAAQLRPTKLAQHDETGRNRQGAMCCCRQPFHPHNQSSFNSTQAEKHQPRLPTRSSTADGGFDLRDEGDFEAFCMQATGASVAG